MSNVSSVTNFFSTANEGFATTLGNTISAGATTVPLAGTSGLTNGSIFVGIIEPGQANQQVFTGTVNVSGSSITSVVWTRGTNNSHIAGVVIVDYVTGTDWNMMTTGILKFASQTGTLLPAAVQAAITSGSNLTIPGTLSVTGVSTFTGGFSNATMSMPYKFSVWRSASLSVGSATALTPVVFDTEAYDTGSNYSTSTGKFTAPVAGFYKFEAYANTTIETSDLLYINLFKNGTLFAAGNAASNSSGGNQSIAVSVCPPAFSLSANDYITVSIGHAGAYTMGLSNTQPNLYFGGGMESLT